MIHHKESVFFFAAVVAGDGDIALRLLIFYIRFRKRKVHLYVAGDGDIALQGEDRTARAPGPLTLSQYRIAAFLNTSRQWICKFILC